MDEFKQRLVEEYLQLGERKNKLSAFMSLSAFDTHDDTTRSLLHAQHAIMIAYIRILELRAGALDIELPDY